MATPACELTVGEAGEQAVIAAIRHAAPSARNGDDAAVLSASSPNSRVVVATDMLVQDRHFTFEYSTPEEIGIKAITANFADIEAMGARPISALLGLSLPEDTPLSTVAELAKGIARAADGFSAELVGGDVTGGEKLVVAITAIGSLGGDFPELTLDRARPGQRVIAHGPLGYSAAGFDLLRAFGRSRVPERLRVLVDAHCAPQLKPSRGVIARATGATAMTDVSDGLAVDLENIAKASAVGIDLAPAAIAPDEVLRDAASLLDVDPWKWVLTGGEDHALVGTTSAQTPSGYRVVGEVIRGSGVTVGGKVPAYQGGWTSF